MKEKIKYSDITSEIIDKKFPKFTTKKWKKRQDSLMKLQIILDNKNTKQLIDIIENHGGYPGSSISQLRESISNANKTSKDTEISKTREEIILLKKM